jgi:Protein of unknown function (DUF1631)
VALARDDDDAVHGFAACVANAVSAVLRSPLEGASFSSAWELLERSWGDFESTRRKQREREQRQREHAERRAALAQRFAGALMERFRKVALPELVASFLRGPWSQVLAEVNLRSDDKTPDPRGYLALVDDLAWSVQRPADGRDYARLVRLIPPLLARINEGLVLIHYPQEPVSIFLDQLSALHEKALDDHRSAIAAGRLAQSARSVRAALEADAQPGSEAPGPEQLPEQDSGLGHDSFFSDDLAGVEAGQWADLLLGGVWVRARLTWISQNRSLYMFVSGAGLAHAMTRRTMDRLQSQGRLRLGFAPPSLDMQIDTLHGVLTPLADDDAADKSSG